jgi:hypothetical protein
MKCETIHHDHTITFCIFLSSCFFLFSSIFLIVDGMQKLELAHVVAARRLQEAGALGGDNVYVPAQERLNLMLREAMKNISAAGGDAETAAAEARASLGRFLDELPTAEDAIDFFMSTSAPPRFVKRHHA